MRRDGKNVILRAAFRFRRERPPLVVRFPSNPLSIPLPMHFFPIVSLVATALGGAVALAASLHYLAGSRSRRDSDLFDELDRRERSLAALCEKLEGELAAKRALLESLTRRANDAAATLGRTLDAISASFESEPSTAWPRR